MAFPDEQYLPALQSNWLAAGFPIASYCAFEEQDTHGVRIVDRQSATNLCTQRLDPIDADHINIVKPRGMDDAPYLAFRSAYEATRSPSLVRATSVEQKDINKLTPKVKSLGTVFNGAIDWGRRWFLVRGGQLPGCLLLGLKCLRETGEWDARLEPSSSFSERGDSVLSIEFRGRLCVRNLDFCGGILLGQE